MNENNVQQDAATDGNVPQSDAASSGTLPHVAETDYNILPHNAERTPDHTLVVRDVVRLFEAANIFISERTITNWCHPNKKGISRLDGFYDEQERCWFITPASVHKILEEEKKNMRKGMPDLSAVDSALSAIIGNVPQPEKENAANSGNFPQQGAESFRAIPQDNHAGQTETQKENPAQHSSDNESKRIRELEEQLRKKDDEIMDLKILNKGKEYFMEQMKETNAKLIDNMKEDNKLIGELKTKMLQIGGPKAATNLNENSSATARVFNVGEEH